MYFPGYYVYILSNKHKNVLYVGVTNNLKRRVQEHKDKLVPGFTKKYNVDRLMYFETFSYIVQAIDREKQIKKYSREKKDNLIDDKNSDWEDLYETI